MDLRPRTFILAATACSLAASLALAFPQQAPGTGSSNAPAKPAAPAKAQEKPAEKPSTPPPAAPAGKPATPPAAAPADQAPPAPVAPVDLPDAKVLLEKHIAAIGGAKAIDAVESCHYKGTLDSMMGKMELEVASKRPNLFLVRQGMAGMGSQEFGSDGTLAWATSPMSPEPQLLEGEMAAQAADGADLQTLVRLVDKRFKEFKVVGKEQFNGKDCWKVEMKHPSGQPMSGLFDAEGGLLQGLQISTQTPQGPMVQSMMLSDWEKVGDVLVFKTMTIDQMGMTMSMKFTDFEFNTIDAAFFKAPEAVLRAAEAKAKAKEEAAKPAAGGAPAKPEAPAAPAAPAKPEAPAKPDAPKDAPKH